MAYREELPTDIDILLTTYGLVTMHQEVDEEDINLQRQEITFRKNGKRYLITLRELLSEELL